MRGFIRAKVMKYKYFIALRTEQAVKDAVRFHIEGKNYVVCDIIQIRFNMSLHPQASY